MVPMRMSSNALIEVPLNDDLHPLARIGAFYGAENHGERTNVVAPDGFGFAPRSNGSNEIRENAEMPVDPVLRRERRGLDRGHRVEEALAFASSQNLDPDLIRPVQVSAPFAPT